MTRYQEFMLGRDYWYEYLKVNGFAMDYTEKGVSKLGRLLDLTPAHVRRCIHAFLHT